MDLEWIIGSNAWWPWRLGLTVVGGTLALGFLWWALSDLMLATFELPFAEMVERVRRRGISLRKSSRDDGDAPQAA